LRSGECVLLFQGLQTVTAKVVAAPKAKHAALVRGLKQPIPTDWQKAAYSGYDFITNTDGPTASEIAVLAAGQYWAAPADSQIGQLVKVIARIDK
jgi:hypothetical protein